MEEDKNSFDRKRKAVNPTGKKLKLKKKIPIPVGLSELLFDLYRMTILCKPDNIYEFLADYVDKLVKAMGDDDDVGNQGGSILTQGSFSPPSFTTRFDQFTSQQIPTTGFTGIGSGSGLPTLSLCNSSPPPSSLITGMQTNTSCSSTSTTSTMEDIASKLESLCLTTTEDALDSAFSNLNISFGH